MQTAEAAAAAERGGAQRIELCADLRVGGLTPDAELMRMVRERVRIPIFAMVRPRAGNFVYSSEEIAQMRGDIEVAQRCGMDGIVLGILTSQQEIDVNRTRELIQRAHPLPVTFHRAFDCAADLDAALEAVIATGAARILTSGGATDAPSGISSLKDLIATAKDRITVLPGGGINASNVQQVARETGAREMHSGLGSVMAYGEKDYGRFESEVRRLGEQLPLL